MGIDPSKNISKIAKQKNINTYVDYFNHLNSKKIKKKELFFKEICKFFIDQIQGHFFAKSKN